MRLDVLLISLVALAWLPANHYFPWGSAWQEGMALAAVGAGAALLTRRAAVPLAWLAFVALALASVVVQQAMGRIHFVGDAWMVALYLAGLLLAIAVGATLVDEGGDRRALRLEGLCFALLAAALASFGIGLAQWAGVQNLGIFGADLGPGSRPFANFGQPNHWCTASFMGLGAAWVLYEARRIGGFTLALLATVLLAAMVISGSRTAWLQMALGVVLLLWLRRRASLRLPLIGVALAVATMVLAWILWPVLNAEADTGNARSLAAQAEAGVRLPLWLNMLDAIARHPWAGYGWQQMVLAQQAVALDNPPLRIHFEHAHNLVLDLLLWVGVPLGLLLIGLATWMLWRLIVDSRDPRAAGLLLAVGGLLAHSMVEFPIEYAYFLMPAGLMLGAAHRLAGTPAFAVPARGARIAGGLFLLALGVTAVDYLKAEQSYRMLRLESARIGVAGIESEAPGLRVLTQLQAFLTVARQQPTGGASRAHIEASQRVAERFAGSSTQFRHARLLALNGDPEGAARMLRLLCAMHPRVACQDAVSRWMALGSESPAYRDVELPVIDLPGAGAREPGR